MLKTFQFQIQKSISDSEFLFTFNVYQMADKDESDLVMVSNESETDSNPRKRQGTLFFLTNPIVKKSKADTKVKKPYDRNATPKCGWEKKCLLIFVGSKLNKVLHNFK